MVHDPRNVIQSHTFRRFKEISTEKKKKNCDHAIVSGAEYTDAEMSCGAILRNDILSRNEIKILKYQVIRHAAACYATGRN